MSKRLTQAEIEELLLAVGDPTTQEEVAQRSKLTKLSKKITGIGDKLRVGVINTLDAIKTNHKRRKFQKFCKKEHIFGVHVAGSMDYDELQRVIQEVLEKSDKMKQYAAMSTNENADLELEDDEIVQQPAVAKEDNLLNQPLSDYEINELMQAINGATAKQGGTPEREM